ncbi:hypothetical protein VdG2_09114 [Verticillium dahliae VDG2]|nr:hypothetical protein VdG2_09114 [Verticillium dahliae VDG2]
MSSPLLCAGPGRAPGERIVALNATVYEFNPFELGPRRIIFGRVAGHELDPSFVYLKPLRYA